MSVKLRDTRVLSALCAAGGSATAHQITISGRGMNPEEIEQFLFDAYRRGELDRNRATVDEHYIYTATYATRHRYGNG